MPPRRSHKKSRAGCRRCKSRKIKCDEVHPRCGNCTKHGVPCDFENPDLADQFLAAPTPTPAQPTTPGLGPLNTTVPPASEPRSASPTINMSPSDNLRTPLSTSAANSFPPLTSASTPPLLWPSPSMVQASAPPPLTYSPSPSPLSLPPSSSPRDRLMELRLMHQYTTMTCKTLSTVPGARSDQVWQTLVPRVVFASTHAPYLADALLAVTALHLRTINPDDRDMIRTCHAYMASSIADYRAALARGVNETNAEALFLTATLISFQSTASRIFLKDDALLDEDGDLDLYHPDQDYADELFIPQSSNRNRSAYTLPLSWFHAFQGVKTIVATSWLKIRHSAVVKEIVDTQPVLHLDLDSVMNNTSFFGSLLEGVDDEMAVEDDEEAGLSDSTRRCYLHAVAMLNWAHKSPHRAGALAFPATVAKRFLDLVEARRPRALAILACFFALLKPLDEVWWLRDVARREVMGIVSLFERGSPWWRHLEWPIRIALYESTTIPPDIWGADCAAEEMRLLLMKREDGVDSVVDHIEMFTQSQAAGVTTTPL